MIRLVALDLDGTLLTSQNAVSPATQAAIIAGRGARHSCHHCHGTAALLRREAVAETLGLSLPLILHGGAVIQESATGTVQYEDLIPPETARAVLGVLLAHGHQPVLYESPAHGGRLFAGPATQTTARRAPTSKTGADAQWRIILYALTYAALAEQTNLLSIAAF